MEVRKVKPTLSVVLSHSLYQRLKSQVGYREVSKFVEKAIAKELGEYEESLTVEQKQFQKKLIADYRRDANSKKLLQEDEIWDEVIEDGIE